MGLPCIYLHARYYALEYIIMYSMEHVRVGPNSVMKGGWSYDDNWGGKHWYKLRTCLPWGNGHLSRDN